MTPYQHAHLAVPSDLQALGPTMYAATLVEAEGACNWAGVDHNEMSHATGYALSASRPLFGNILGMRVKPLTAEARR